MNKTESFESAVKAAMPLLLGECIVGECPKHCDCNQCGTNIADRLRRAHDREIRDTAQQQYDRGFHAGRHSMDAEHRAIAMRLRGLRFDGGSHENLSRIAYAIYPCATGWTCESAAGLRDKLIDLMGGVSDDTCGVECCCAAAACDGRDSGESKEVGHGRTAHDCAADSRGGSRGELVHLDGLVTYDVLGNERRKAVYELRNMHLDTGSAVKKLAIALGIKWNSDNAVRSVTLLQKRLIHLLGGDQPSGIDMMNSYEMRIEKLVRQRDAAYSCANELSDELLRVRHERDEARDECDRLKRDMLDEWVPRTSYEEKVEKYRRAYMESDAWRKSLQDKLNAMRDAITAALNG